MLPAFTVSIVIFTRLPLGAEETLPSSLKLIGDVAKCTSLGKTFLQ